MKVLMFGWEFPPHNSGGLGVACLGLTRALRRLNIDITFVLPKRFSFPEKDSLSLLFADSYGEISFRGVDTLLTPYQSAGEYDLLRQGAPGLYGQGLIEEVLRYAAVAGAIAEDSPHDVIHAHDWLSFPAGIEAKRRSGKPLIVHVHATEFDRVGNGPVNSRVFSIERQGMMEADRVVAVSEYTKHIIVERYGIPAEKVAVVHNGIDEVDFIGEPSIPLFLERVRSQGGKVVLFVGRITLQKGPDYFVQVAKRTLRYVPDVFFVVSGSGDMEGQMIRSVAREGLSDRFIFTGFLRDGELAGVYASADLFIMPSVSEPFGIAPLEAAMYGTPVLISKQAGVSEVLSHALKADFWDIEDMTDKVVSVLRHESLRDHLATGSKSELKCITWNEAAEKCIMLYNQVRGAVKKK